MNLSRVCEAAADEVFGPVISPECRGGFDFTIVFEQFLIIVPTSLFIVVAPFRLLQLSKTSVKVVGGPVLQYLKLVSFLFSSRYC